MPNYKGHLLGGTITFGFVVAILYKMKTYFHYSIAELLLWLVMCLCGALFPDIDIQSKGQKIFYQALFLCFIIAFITKQWVLLIILGFVSLFPQIVRHRGIIHNFWFITITALIIPFSLSIHDKTLTKPALMCYFFFVSGAFSHLLLDFGPRKFIQRTLGKKRRIYRRR